MAAVLSRFTSDATRIVGQLPDSRFADIDSWERAALEADDALRAAVRQFVGNQIGRNGESGQQPSGPAARNVARAASALAAGRDLLHSHSTTDAGGVWHPRSPWAAPLVTPQVTHAILADVGSLARQAGALGAYSRASSRPGVPAEHDARLRAGCYWLTQAHARIDAAVRREPVLREHRELLGQIPVNVMPGRPGTEDRADVASLCAAVVASSERVRVAAWHAARFDAQSPAICVTSWRRIATASTAASHHCHLLCQTLADRADQLGRQGDLAASLRDAAAHADRARAEWLDAALESREVSTETREYVSLAAAEAAELAEWTGRLAYDDPAWTLSAGPHAPARQPELLAPTLGDCTMVLAAVHASSESLAALGNANLQQARSAVHSRRLLVPTSSLPMKYDVPTLYATAPRAHATSLLACYEDTHQSAADLAQQLAVVAERSAAPSRHLATVRSVVQHQADAPDADLSQQEPSRRGVPDHRPHAVGEIEARLRARGVEDPRLLWQAAAVDDAGRQLIAEARDGGVNRAPRAPDPRERESLGRSSVPGQSARPAAGRTTARQPSTGIEAEL